MSQFVVNGSTLGGELQRLLTAQEIVPGDPPSYQLCKTIYQYHPLGGKMAEAPIKKAQSQQREVSVPKGPDEAVVEAFWAEWKRLAANDVILNCRTLARVYGVGSIGLVEDGVPSERPVDWKTLWKRDVAFNVLDPLNTAGSLVLNQDPNAFDFQKPVNGIWVSGRPWHRSRAVVSLNETPIYLGYTTSAFGYVGRSVYQRALFPLKSFIQSMVTDDMVTLKAGVLIEKLKQPGAIIDSVMAAVAGFKRAILRQAATNNVISISIDEAIETLNMQNLDGAYGMARKDILENIAVSADMPAQMLNSETFAEGFGEGSEDAKAVAQYIAREREAMENLYAFMDEVCRRRAWNPEYYATIQRRFPDEYGDVSFEDAYYRWTNSFKAAWPNLLVEPDSEKIKVEETKQKTVVSVAEVVLPRVGPKNKALVMNWMSDNLNQNKMMFTSPLVFDQEELENWEPPVADAAPGIPNEPQPESSAA